jgi:hypothetical protein
MLPALVVPRFRRVTPTRAVRSAFVLGRKYERGLLQVMVKIVYGKAQYGDSMTMAWT